MSAIEELRSQVGVTDLLYDFDNSTYSKLIKAVDVVERENAELRELVRGMWSYINAPVNQRNNLKERLAIYDDLADRMRELGVEVDG